MGAVSNAVDKAESTPRPATTLRDAVKRSEHQFALALPQHVDPKRFLRCALTALNTVPKLAECTESSVLAGLMQAAQLGLEVSDVRGQAYLIPRWDGRDKVNKATFQLGYRGMIDLAARAGITVDTDIVSENDEFDFQRGTDARLAHKPNLKGDPGEAYAYYAVAHFADGRRPQFLIRSRTQIEQHRDRFAQDGGAKGPWRDHFDSMAAKTVIRMLLDKLPTSAELRQAVVNDAPDAPEQATYVAPAVEQPYGAIDTTTGEILAVDLRPQVGSRDVAPEELT